MKLIFCSPSKDSFWLDSGPSRGDLPRSGIRPKHAFKMGPANGRKGRESDRSRYGQDAHNRSFADGSRTGSMTTRRSPGSRPAAPNPSGWSVSVDPGRMIGTYEP